MDNQIRLEDLCGGSNRAFRLLNIWQRTEENFIRTKFGENTVLERKFISNAHNEGYSSEAINFFLDNF